MSQVIASGGIRPRVVFCGMPSPGSTAALRLILEAGLDVVAVVSAAEPPGFPSFTAPPGELGFVDLAGSANLPIISVDTFRDPSVVAKFAGHRPDALVACCFPLRVPRAVLALPPLGCLNIHPSLLPAWRGVEPLFWPLRVGDAETGTTVHLMDASFDTGPILAQERVAIPDGIPMLDLERCLIEVGIRLLLGVINDLLHGTARSIAQDDRQATNAPLPAPADLIVSTDRIARWAFGFVRGVAHVYGPLTVQVLETGDTFPVWDALDYDPDGRLDQPVVHFGDEILVRFTPGVVRFALTSPQTGWTSQHVDVAVGQDRSAADTRDVNDTGK